MKPIIAKLKQGALITNPTQPYHFLINNPLITQTNLEQRWTFEAWVKVAADTNTVSYLVRGIGAGLLVRNSNDLPLLYLNSGDNDYYRYGSKSIKDGTYHHIAFTFDNTTTERNIYIDGVLANSGSGPNKTSTPTAMAAVLLIARTCKMSFHDLRIWNYARTAQQIKDNYDKVIKPQDGLVGYYKLNGDVLDSSGFGNDGYSLNATTEWSTTDVSPSIESFKFLSTDGYGSALFPVGDVHLKSTNRILSFIPSEITLMAWVKSTNIAKDQLFLSNASGNYFRIVSSRPFYSLNVPSQSTVSAAITLQSEKWYHMAMSWSVSDNIMRCYLDGVMIASRTGANNTTNPTPYVNFGSSTLRIGRFTDTDPRNLEGNLFNVQLWSKCLIQDEINQYRYQIFTPDTPDLISNYPLIIDGTDVNGNDGINYGVTWNKDTPYKRILTSN